MIAQTWVDCAYKQRLLTNATAAVAELGVRYVSYQDDIDGFYAIGS
jgi:hypothetical protein